MLIDEELKLCWSKAEAVLLQAFSLLREEETLLYDTHFEFREFIANNELGLAFETLMDIGLEADIQVVEYWRLLAQASSVMLLEKKLLGYV